VKRTFCDVGIWSARSKMVVEDADDYCWLRANLHLSRRSLRTFNSFFRRNSSHREIVSQRTSLIIISSNFVFDVQIWVNLSFTNNNFPKLLNFSFSVVWAIKTLPLNWTQILFFCCWLFSCLIIYCSEAGNSKLSKFVARKQKENLIRIWVEKENSSQKFYYVLRWFLQFQQNSRNLLQFFAVNVLS
jgi:hypothetical protein